MTLDWETNTGPQAIDPITRFRLDQDRETHPDQAETRWWSAIIGLTDTSIGAFEVWAQQHQLAEDLLIPDIYDDRSTIRPSQYVTLFARAPALRAMNRPPLLPMDQVGTESHVTSVHLGGFVPREQLDLDPPADILDQPPTVEPEPIAWPDGTVVTAVIDDGIAFANSVFRDGPTSSRVEGVYIMAARAGQPTPGRGIVLSKQSIDQCLQANIRDGLLDEDSVYRQVGLIDFSDGTFSSAALRRSHGTGVMALAAGYAMDKAPSTRPILCAILPSEVTEDTSGHNLLPSLLLAIFYLMLQASRFKIKKGQDYLPAPVVFNFSYGSHGGPHDGTGPIPWVLSLPMYLGLNTVPVVLPAGNSNLTRTHARVVLDTRSTVTLDLRVSPDDRTASFVEMWVPSADLTGQPPSLRLLRVTPPWGKQSAPVDFSKDRSSQNLLDENNNVVGELSWRIKDQPIRTSKYKGVVTLCIRPTASFDRRLQLAPSGIWKIEFTGTGIDSKDAIEVWVLRDETIPGYPPHGRQSYFDNPSYELFDPLGKRRTVDPADSDSPVRRAGTLSGFATRETTIVIGGLTASSGLMSGYSSTGHEAVADQDPIEPIASARSDESPALPGVLSAGSRSGSMARFSGTSFAAPVVARHLADRMAKGSPPADGWHHWLQQQAEEQDRHFENLSAKPPKNRTGAGRLTWHVDWLP